jgi:hypothetical protein
MNQSTLQNVIRSKSGPHNYPDGFWKLISTFAIISLGYYPW